MPEPQDSSDEALKRLGQDLETFEAKRSLGSNQPVGSLAASEGYRIAAGLLGGVFGGLGLGWLFDHFTHMSPFGLIGGLIIGTGGSVYAAIRGASRVNVAGNAIPGPTTSDQSDEED